MADDLMITIKTEIDSSGAEEGIQKLISKYSGGSAPAVKLKVAVDDSSIKTTAGKAKKELEKISSVPLKLSDMGDTKALFDELSKAARTLRNDIKEIQQIRITNADDSGYKAIVKYNTALGETGTLSIKASKDLQNLELAQKSLLQKYNAKAATKLAPTTIPEARKTYNLDLSKTEQDLSRAGMLTDEFKAKIDTLRTSLNAVGDADKVGLTNWISQFRTLTAEIKSFKESTQGIALSIQNDQVANIGAMLNNPAIATGQTDGIKALRTELQSLQEEYTKVITSLSSGNLSPEDFQRVTTELENLDTRLKDASKSAELFNGSISSNDKLANAGNNIQKLGLIMQEYERQYKGVIQSTPELASKFNEIKNAVANADAISLRTLRSQVSELGAELKTAAGESVTFSGTLKSALQDSGALGQGLARVFSVYKIFQTGARMIREMVSEIRALDAATLELQKVTGLSGQALDNFTQSAFKAGQALGRTGTDVIEAVATFSRAGYELNEAQSLAQAALVMTNIGADIDSTAEAASSMISVLKAFGIEAEDAMSVVDKLYAISNLEPVDFGNINQMLVTAGGTLAQTGTTLEQTVSMLTGAFATMRNPEVSRGLIMISQRLRGVTEDGEAIEGLMPKLAAEFKAIGIDIEDSMTGELRSTYDILNDLAGVWNTLSSKQRQMIGEDVAGNRQVRTLNALMGNWDVVQNSLRDANESAGAAMEGNALFEESIQGRINKLTAAFQQLADTTIGSGLVKSLVDIGTSLLTVANNAGGLQTVLIPILGIIGVAQWNNFSKLILGIGKAFTTATGSLSVFRLGLTGVIAALGIAVAAYNSYRSSVEQARQASIDAGKKAYDNAQTIISSYTEYKSLSAITGRTTEQEQAMKTALEQTTAALGEKAKALEGLTAGTDEYNTALESATQKELETALGALTASRSALVSKALEIEGFQDNIVLPPEIAENLQEQLNNIPGLHLDLPNLIDENAENIFATLEVDPSEMNGVDDVLNAYYALIDVRTQLGKLSAEYESNGNTEASELIAGSGGMQSINAYVGANEELAKSLIETYVQWNVVNDALNDNLPDTGEELDEYIQKMIDATGATGDYADAVAESVRTQIHIPVTVEPEIDTGEITEKPSIDLFTTIEQATGALFKQSDAYKALTEAMAEQNKQGVLSLDTYQKLLKENEAFAEMLTLTAEGYVLDSEKLSAYIEEQDKGIRQLALYNIDKLQEQLRINPDDTGLQKQLGEWVTLKREIDGATSALARWREANSTPDEDSGLHEYQSMYKDYSEALKSGKVGTDQFQNATAAILGEDWKSRYGTNAEAYKDAQKKLKRYTATGDKNADAKAADNFIKDLQKNGLVDIDENGMMSTTKTIEEIAQSLGVSSDLVTAAFSNINSFNDEDKFEFPELLTPDEKKEVSDFADTMAKLAQPTPDTLAPEEGGVEINTLSTALKTEADRIKEDVDSIESNIQRYKDLVDEWSGDETNPPSGTETPPSHENLNPANVITPENRYVQPMPQPEAESAEQNVENAGNDLATAIGAVASTISTMLEPYGPTPTPNPTPTPTPAPNPTPTPSSTPTTMPTPTPTPSPSYMGSERYSVTDEHSSMYGIGSTEEISASAESAATEIEDGGETVASALEDVSGEIRGVEIPNTPEPTTPKPTENKTPTGSPGVVEAKIYEGEDLAKGLDSASQEAQTLQAAIDGARDAVNNYRDAEVALAQTVPNTAAYEQASAQLETAAQDLLNAESALDNATVTVTVGTKLDTARKNIQSLSNVKVTITPTVRLPEEGGLAHGTQNAKEGVSLVDDGIGANAGPELIVHNKRGTFEMGSGDSPRLTHLDKGDTVYTAPQTRRILSKIGKVGGFFRNGLNNAKSLIGGAFATGVGGSASTYWINQVLNSVTGGGRRRTGSGSGSSGGSGGSSNSFKKFQKWFKQLFDWVEIRLARLQTVTNAWIQKATEAIGYMARNKDLDKALESIANQIENTSAAYDEYMETAEEVGRRAGLSEEIIRKIQEGEIDVASYDSKMQEKIRAYQEWYDRAQECVEALGELREQERELAGQKLDNILNHYQWRVDRLDAIVKYNGTQIDYMNAIGREIFSNNYNQSIDATLSKIEELTESRRAFEEEFTKLVESGLIVEESEQWYEYTGKLEDLDNSIVQTRIELQELIDTANDISLTKLQYAMSAIEESASAISRMMDLHEVQGLDNVDEDYASLIRNGMEQIANLERQNEELYAQQEGLDVLSEKYQSLQEQINSNLDAISQIKVQQEEWNDAVLDLKISQLEKYKEQLQKTNDQYQRQKELQQALEELEKARSQRTVRVFRGEDAGFVWEADQDALRQTQENLENVIQNQLLAKIDDLIDAINEAKNDTNVYDSNGVLLGTEYSLPSIGDYASLLRDYGKNDVITAAMEEARRIAYEQIMGGITNNTNSPNITIGDIIVQGVDDVDAFANAIREQFPNAILQSLYSKP